MDIYLFNSNVISRNACRQNENQAILDFKNGRKPIVGDGFISDETIKKREKLSAKYGIEYDYVFGCLVMVPESRIVNRYNQMMKELAGAENLW
ncbi:hypothetical protein [Maribacter sp. 2307UL18-2]|uniref:FEKKY domain-containing protein n=1 Tax=Maribacter sp. 2307UL18-2 TaxID=3386274 RepID=UPI0039BD3139